MSKTDRRLTFTTALVAVGITACGPTEEPPAGTAITNVTVIDAVNGLREGQTVIFDGDEILAVQPASEPVNAVTEIDGSGQFLIPGLWDMHVHLTYDDAFTESMPSMFLAYGITSVRDTGGLIRKMRPVIDAMRAEDAVAPRVFFSGPLLDGQYVVYDGESRPEIGTQNAGVEAAWANVEALHNEGVDFIKIYEMVTPQVFEALHAAAAEYDLPIAAHVPLSMRARGAGPQVDSMEHLRNVELDCASNAAELHEERLGTLAAHDGGPGFELRSSMHSAQRLRAIAAYDERQCAETIASLRSTTQVPTLLLNTLSLFPPFVRQDWDTVLDRVPAAAEADWRAATARWLAREDQPDTTFGEWSVDLVGRMNAAGVPIGAGTDTPIGFALPGDSLHIELERLNQAGMSPVEVLEAATIRPASFFSLEEEMGQVATGFVADMLLLGANPLNDIRNTRSIVRVISAGRVLEPSALLSDALAR